MSSPSRFLSGVATVDTQYPLGQYPFPDPFHTSGSAVTTTGSSSYTNDFNTLIGTDYTVSGTSSTFALGNGVGGVAVLTPGGATTATAAYKPGTFVQFQSGNKLWFTVRFKASAVSSTKSFYVGLRNGSSATDGLWFSKAASSTSVNLVSTVGSTATTLVTGVATAADDTYLELSVYFDGTDLLVWNEHNLVARVTGPTIGTSATTLTSVVLSPVFQITPTATDTLTVDFVMVAQEVTR
jgi:hypothetical protein